MKSETIYCNCPECNANLVIMDNILTITCNDCGIKLAYDPKSSSLQVLGDKVDIFDGEVKTTTVKRKQVYGKKRIYFIYFLFGLVTLGIGLIVYMLRNLKDLETHHSNYDLEKGAEPILTHGEFFPSFNSMFRDRLYMSPWYAGLYVIFTIAYDLLTAPIEKYSSLHYHLKDQGKETAPTKSPHSAWYVTGLVSYLVSMPVVILTLILNLLQNFSVFPQNIIFYVSCGLAAFGFLMITICGAIWQKAFNDHIKVMDKITN